jgi:hypothetical protein
VEPDFLFMGAGIGVLCWAGYLLLKAVGKGPQRQWLAVLLWATFGLGLLIQGFTPRLRIEHRAFVVPASLLSTGKDVRPAEIVARQRHMQLLSSLLTTLAAIGLCCYYRRLLFRPRAPPTHISQSDPHS